MNWNTSLWTASLFCCVVEPGVALAAEAPKADQPRAKTEKPRTDGIQKNPEFTGRFFVNGTVGFNYQAKFSGFGRFPQQSNIGPAAGPADRRYDDGFNLVENNGVADTRTYKWGFNNLSQINAANDTISFNSHSAVGALSSSDATGDAQPGAEIGYMHRIGFIGKASWGVLVSANYQNIDVTDRKGLVGDAQRITDVFDASGATLPSDVPFDGTIDPNSTPRIENVPTSRATTFLANSRFTSGERQVEADFFSAKLGPYIEYPITERIDIGLSAGFLLTAASSRFSYTEANRIAGMGPGLQPGIHNPQTFSGSADKSTVLPGAFVGLNLSYHVNERWNIFAGGQYQYLENLTIKAQGREATLDLGGTFLLQLGAGYSF